jgi:hypothetical protein
MLNRMILDAQFSPGNNDWPQLRDAILRAEAEGFNTAWVFDHFDGAMLGGDRPMLECFTLLGAMAAATTTLGLGTLVANVANRHPAVLTLAASSVQRISNGRLRLGIGAGASPASPFGREHAERGIVLEPDIARRHDAVIHQIALLREVEPMPIIVGVNSIALTKLALAASTFGSPTIAVRSSSGSPASTPRHRHLRSRPGASSHSATRPSLRPSRWVSIDSCWSTSVRCRLKRQR